MGFLGESASPASCLGVPIGAGTRSPPELMVEPEKGILIIKSMKNDRSSLMNVGRRVDYAVRALAYLARVRSELPALSHRKLFLGNG